MQARLVESIEIAPEVRHFVFEAGTEHLDFAPGQFVSFTADVAGKPITRAYSVASIPAGKRFELCLNRVENGRLSPHLFAMQPGDAIEMTGPLGTFVLREPPRDFWPTLTRPTETWAGRTGRVQAHLEAAIAGRRDLDFYLCGLKEMVDQVRGILKEMGFDRKQIRAEKYD